MTSEGKFILGCFVIPCLLVVSPLYLAALIFAWPVILPLTGLLVWAVWRWNENAKARAAEAQSMALAYQQGAYTVFEAPQFATRQVVNCYEREPTSLDDDDDMI